MKTLNLLLLPVLICFIGFHSYAQNSRWIWANQFSDSLKITDHTCQIRGITVDKDNNVLMSIDYYNSYSYKISVAKVTGNESVVFNKVLDYGWYIYSEKIITDNNGNFYIAGRWGRNNDTLHLDTLIIGNRKFCRVGGFDVFIIKYNPNGEIIWSNTYGSKENEYFAGMYIGLTGNLNAYIEANGKGSNLFFNSVGDIIKTNNDRYIHLFDNEFYYTLDIDSFKKYDINQKLLCQTSTGLKSSHGIFTYKVMANSKYFYSVGYFDDLNWGKKTYISRGGNDIMIGKFDTLGTLIWLKTIGGKFDDYARKIILDRHENIYTFIRRPDKNYDSIYVDSNTVIYRNGMCLVKYDSSGNLVFADKVDNVSCYDMSIDSDAKLYFGGKLTDTARFGKTALNSINYLFLAKYDTGFVSNIGNTHLSHKINIYPNPSSSGYFNILSDDIKNQKVAISVYDILGNQVLSIMVEVKDRLNQVIQLPDVSKGIYILKLSGKGKMESYSTKLILN